MVLKHVVGKAVAFAELADSLEVFLLLILGRLLKLLLNLRLLLL